jgi:hypothetical protein
LQLSEGEPSKLEQSLIPSKPSTVGFFLCVALVIQPAIFCVGK